MKFKVLAGKHTERNAKGIEETFGPNSVVESNRQLDKLFNCKFEQLDDNAKVSKPLYISNNPAVPTMPEVAPDVAKVDIDVEKTEKDHTDDPGEPDTVLKAVMVSRGKWDVIKVVDGEDTEEEINDDYLSKKEAMAIQKAGYEAWVESNEE